MVGDFVTLGNKLGLKLGDFEVERAGLQTGPKVIELLGTTVRIAVGLTLGVFMGGDVVVKVGIKVGSKLGIFVRAIVGKLLGVLDGRATSR